MYEIDNPRHDVFGRGLLCVAFDELYSLKNRVAAEMMAGFVPFILNVRFDAECVAGISNSQYPPFLPMSLKDSGIVPIISSPLLTSIVTVFVVARGCP